MCLSGPALEMVQIGTVNLLSDLEELNADFKLFDTLTKLATGNSIQNLKYLMISFEGIKEETNYPALYKKLDAALKKSLSVIIQGDTNCIIPCSVGMTLKKLDVISHKYNDGV